MKGLFINSKKHRCSIYESGKMIFDCLLKSKRCLFDYVEVDELQPNIKTGYDIYLFNYHHGTMAWFDVQRLKNALGFVMSTVLEVLPGDPFPRTRQEDFDIFLVIDPTIESNGTDIFSFPRPLEVSSTPPPPPQIPTIGSFGFPSLEKGFFEVVRATVKEFEKAVVKINLPIGDFDTEAMKMAFTQLKQSCESAATNNVEVQISSVFFEKTELINWLASNTVNCLFYDRDCPGLSATLDQVVASGRPFSVTNNQTFRHILKYIKPYPDWSIKDSIEKTPPIIEKIKNDWSQEAFAKQFDEMLYMINLKKNRLKNVKNKFFNLKTGLMGPLAYSKYLARPFIPTRIWYLLKTLKNF